ncbi:AAA family ATPase [Bradyrhizobium zhanjiangense]|uniref:ATPase AAA-type core domain-containing protein n=1 Tax=Bradyrhizobium zhanjiangense TaxID=1325107 RepID=A0A4Q0S6D2_9BRAD|nr:AAA family ATPase [Bradyrhizobium zhanjiangense]RXH30897.1 hypothetical protein XH94_34915 [Bradyrhizobium zhanjiangense]
MADPDAMSKGAEPSIVESFSIEGLYGYRTISLSSKYAATILIAKNGSGKTTLLAALDAFLRGQLSRLRDLDFRQIRCKLRGSSEIVLKREHLHSYLTFERIGHEARRFDLEPFVLLGFIEGYAGDFEVLFADDEVPTKLIHKLGYDRNEVHAFCLSFKASLIDHVPEVREAVTAIRKSLVGTEIVYLPTYRRIELAIVPVNRPERPNRRRAVVPGIRASLYSGEIQFGLADILERLSQLNQRIVSDSNLGYREISASIINELIDGRFDLVTPTPEEIPEKEELELFFSRLKDQRRRYGPYDELSLPNIDRIYTGQDISDERNRFLRYFLAKLNTVIRATSDIETLVRAFIDNCNNYLSSRDLSTDLPGRASAVGEGDIDDKVLTLSRRDLKVTVRSLKAGRPIPLDALSSGEKQMISLFAKLFLYPENKIVLIDEPELSLSIDWQKQILVDVINAPLCRQVIAITHSPFIFDNALEPFAKSLVSSIDSDKSLGVAEEEEDDE